jgi:valyl-tRNA synthetase
MRTEVSRAAIAAPREVLDRLAPAETDIRAAGRIQHMTLEEHASTAVEVKVTF